MSKKTKILAIQPAGDNHQVVTVSGAGTGSSKRYRRKPCAKCPWRTDAAGEFPAAAFKHSAGTAYDMAQHTFACHDSGTEKPAICAGFLLRGAEHNLSIRLARMKGEIQDDVQDGGLELFENYRRMAIANGVDPDDPDIGPCRD